MKNSLLASLVFFAAPLPAFAVVTLQGVISGLASGTAPGGYASVGAGTPVSFSFDLPDVPGTPLPGGGGHGYAGSVYPLAAALVGAPLPVPSGFQFSIHSGRFSDPVTTGPDRVICYGNVGNVGNPVVVFIRSVQFDDPAGTALEGAVTSQAASIPLVEAALQARRFQTGTLTLVDQVGPALIGHEWSYTFSIVPEPASMLLAGTGVVLAWRRRRPLEFRAGSVPVELSSHITSPPRQDSRQSP